jgi:hypothetical protein
MQTDPLLYPATIFEIMYRIPTEDDPQPMWQFLKPWYSTKEMAQKVVNRLSNPNVEISFIESRQTAMTLEVIVPKAEPE